MFWFFCFSCVLHQQKRVFGVPNYAMEEGTCPVKFLGWCYGLESEGWRWLKGEFFDHETARLLSCFTFVLPVLLCFIGSVHPLTFGKSFGSLFLNGNQNHLRNEIAFRLEQILAITHLLDGHLWDQEGTEAYLLARQWVDRLFALYSITFSYVLEFVRSFNPHLSKLDLRIFRLLWWLHRSVAQNRRFIHFTLRVFCTFLVRGIGRTFCFCPNWECHQVTS